MMRIQICLLLMLLLGTNLSLADIAMQENLDQIAAEVNFRFLERDCEFECDAFPNQVKVKVEESKEGCHHMVSIG